MEADYTLSDEEVQQYFEQGFLGPFELDTDRDIDEIRHHVEDLLDTEGPWQDSELPDPLLEDVDDGARVVDRHIDCEVVADVAQDPAISQRLASLYGKNLSIIFTEFLKKLPGKDTEVGWHQDDGFFRPHPTVCGIAWVALDEVTAENGAIEFAPGTHDGKVPHEDAGEDNQWLDVEVDPQWVSENVEDLDTVTMEMEPGEFVLFHDRVVHRSLPNTSDDRRLGFHVRSTVPYAYIDGPKRPETRMMMQHGENNYGVHDMVSPPDSCQH